MKKGQQRVFTNRYVLSEMLAWRYYGFSTTSLANLYGCDRSSIETQCDKYGVRPIGMVFTPERFIQLLPKREERQWFVTDGVKVCAGKNYKDYLK